jgi:hypothetical protein
MAGAFLTYTLEPDFFEKEILTLLSISEKSQIPALRLLQLEQELQGDLGPITVVYDRGGLRASTSSRLNVRYCPVSVQRGCFHPKVIALLTEPVDKESTEGESLIVGVLSANLTQNGWWRSLEAAHFEVIQQDSECGFRNDLSRMLNQVDTLIALEVGRAPIKTIRAWLTKNVRQSPEPKSSRSFQTRLYWGYTPFSTFCEKLPGRLLEDRHLEIISPFFDSEDPKPLRAMIESLVPRELRVFLPTDRDGAALCTEKFYQAVSKLPGTTWAPLDDRLLTIGKDTKAQRRGVHAKLYRFTDVNFEVVLVGSHNLTRPALEGYRNFEASFLVRRDGKAADQWWLGENVRRPKTFAPAVEAEEEGLSLDTVIPVQMAYDWATKVGQYRWEGNTASDGDHSRSPEYRVTHHGVDLFLLPPVEGRQWSALPAADATRLAEALKTSALVTLYTSDNQAGTILVQETGMTRKPSMLVTLSVTDILEFWSRLTPEQQSEFLESRLSPLQMEEDAAALQYRPIPAGGGFFETYAGVFHGFEMMRQRVLHAIEEGKEERADYLLFGDHHDSLPRMISKIEAADDGVQPLVRYLIFLTARQLLEEFGGLLDVPFFQDRKTDVRALLARTKATASVTSQLALEDDAEQFLAWFESHFLKRAKPSASMVDD